MAQEVFLFQPTSITGCQLWLDAADRSTFTFTGSNVTAWRDKVANFSLTGSTPYTIIADRPTVQFTGSTGLVASSYPYASVCTNNTNFTSFLVQTTRSTTGVNSIPFDITNSANAAIRMMIFVNSSGGLFVDAGTQTSPRLFSATNFTVNVPQLLVVGRSGATGDTVVYRKNGAQDSILTSGGSSFSSNTYNVALSSSLGRWTGEMYEVIHYNNSITNDQIQQVEGYLSWKWGLQANLPANHPFKNYRPLAVQPIPTQVPTMPIVTQNVNVFAPTQISGCRLWLDAADSSSFVLSGSAITQWNDKSGNGNSPTLVNSPSYVSGQYPYVATRNTNQYFTVPADVYANSSGQSVSLFIVYNDTKTSGASNFTVLCGTSNSATSYIQVLFRPDPFSYYFGGTTLTALNTTNTVLFCISFSFGTSNTTVRINGSPVTLPSPPSISPSGILTFAAYTTGQDITNLNFNEIISIRSLLSVSQREQVEGYLAWKWGLQGNLPAGHPYKNQPIAPFAFTTIPRAISLSVWLPLQVSSCSLWLDATSGVNGNVWSDKSPSANNATRISGTITTTTVNGIQALLFPSSVAMSYSNNLIFNGTTGSSCFIVFSVPNVFNFHLLTCLLGGINNHLLWGDQNLYESIGFSSRQTIGGFSHNTLQMYTNIANRSGNTIIFRNGSQLFSSSYGSGYTSLSYSVSTWSGTVCDILVYTRTLILSEQQQVEGYLAWKWGLQGSLPGNHPFKRWPPSP